MLCRELKELFAHYAASGDQLQMGRGSWTKLVLCVRLLT